MGLFDGLLGNKQEADFQQGQVHPFASVTPKTFIPLPLLCGPISMRILTALRGSITTWILTRVFLQPVAQGLAPQKGRVLITFQPSGAQVNARPGEALTLDLCTADAAICLCGNSRRR